MSATRIMRSLEEVTDSQVEAAELARAGFLRWVLCLPEGSGPRREAALAVSSLQSCAPQTDAGRAFLSLLEMACLPSAVPRRKGGVRARRQALH